METTIVLVSNKYCGAMKNNEKQILKCIFICDIVLVSNHCKDFEALKIRSTIQCVGFGATKAKVQTGFIFGRQPFENDSYARLFERKI